MYIIHIPPYFLILFHILSYFENVHNSYGMFSTSVTSRILLMKKKKTTKSENNKLLSSYFSSSITTKRIIFYNSWEFPTSNFQKSIAELNCLSLSRQFCATAAHSLVKKQKHSSYLRFRLLTARLLAALHMNR